MNSGATSLRQHINSLMHRLGMHVTQHPDPGRLPWILKNLDAAPSPLRWIAPELIRQHDLKTFVQVGANDGENDDPFSRCIAEFPLQGILVEPQPGACAKLRQKHASNPRLIVDQVAISETPGHLTLYHFGSENIEVRSDKEVRADLLTSGSREHMERMRDTLGLTCPIEELKVPALTWQGLLQKHGMSTPDMVIVDTEGMDDVIVNQVATDEHGPAFIQLESLHLSSARLKRCTDRLEKSGYRFIMSEYDLLCLHPRVL